MDCISCGHNSFTLYSKTSGLDLPVYRCSNCELYVTGDPEIIKEKIHKLYEKDYWNKRNSEFSISSDYLDQDSQGKRRNWLSQYAYCRPYLKDKKELLEIGSGGGQAIYWFEQEGFRVSGIEPDPRNVELINKKLKTGKCQSGYAEEIEIIGSYDVVWMSHVLEHMVKPDLFLKKIKSNLKNDGVFFIEVPNCENKDILDNTLASQPHTYHFTRQSLINVIEKSGYKIIRSDYFRPASITEGVVNRVLKKLGKSVYQYYPRIISTAKQGRDLRIVFTH